MGEAKMSESGRDYAIDGFLSEEERDEICREQCDIAFVQAWNETANAVNQNARNKGFWERERNDAEMIALMHSELSHW